MHCLICDIALSDIMDNYPPSQPDGGVTVTIAGQYGSRVFDPMSTREHLRAFLCDRCLTTKAHQGRIQSVLVSKPRPTYDVKPWVPELPAEHEMTIVPSPKMDTPSLVASVCSCGKYRSGPTTENDARKSWQQHVDAKKENS